MKNLDIYVDQWESKADPDKRDLRKDVRKYVENSKNI